MLTITQLKDIIDIQAMLVSGDFNLARFMNIVVERVQALTGATGAVIELIEGEEMVYHAATGTVSPYVGLKLKMANSLSGVCVRSGEITVSEDTATDPRVDALACKKVRAASMVVLPLSRKREIIGVLKVVSNQPRAFDEAKIQTLQLMAGMLGGALGQQMEIEGRQKLEGELRHMAHHDPLTGLPNRILFNDRLNQAIVRSHRSKGALALMYMDVDHFKRINDTYGHAAGDALLKRFSARVQSLVRASDTFARLGGDEFALIAEGIDGKSEAEFIARKLVAGIAEPFDLDEQIVKVGTSIGIATLNGAGTSATKLLRCADGALYEAKRAGRGVFRLSECA